MVLQKNNTRRIVTLSNNYLKECLYNGLIASGSNAIQNILSIHPQKIEYIIVSENYNSNKVKSLIERSAKLNIPIILNGSYIKFITNIQDDFSKTNVIAILKPNIKKYYSLKEILTLNSHKSNLLCLAFNEIDYPQNIGAILRTAYAFNVDFILISNRTLNVFDITISKVSMGANFLMPIVKENFFDAVKTLRSQGFLLIGLDIDGENIQSIVYNNYTCIFLGNEEKGLSDTLMDKLDKIVSIPINKSIDSLNVSVATGIILYDRILKNEFKK